MREPIQALRSRVARLRRDLDDLQAGYFTTSDYPREVGIAIASLDAARKALEAREAALPRIFILDEFRGFSVVGFHRGGHPVVLRRFPGEYTAAAPIWVPRGVFDVVIPKPFKFELLSELADLTPQAPREETRIKLKVFRWVVREKAGAEPFRLFARCGYDSEGQRWVSERGFGARLRAEWVR